MDVTDRKLFVFPTLQVKDYISTNTSATAEVSVFDVLSVFGNNDVHLFGAFDRKFRNRNNYLRCLMYEHPRLSFRGVQSVIANNYGHRKKG